MGDTPSKANTVPPEPVPTTVTAHTTVYTPTSGFKDSEHKCWIDNSPEILYISLAFVSGILVTVLLFLIIHLFRKRYKRSHQNSQVPFQGVTEEPAKDTQTEAAYSTVAFHRRQTPV